VQLAAKPDVLKKRNVGAKRKDETEKGTGYAAYRL
jgi:hypothetical protein